MTRSIRVVVDSQSWTIPFPQVTAVDVGAYHRSVGRRLREALEPRPDLDIDEIAGLVWLALRHEQPALTYRQVASEITLDAIASVLVVEEED